MDDDYEIYWEPTFERSLGAMGLTFEQFDRLGKFGVDFLLQRDPFEPESTFELSGTGHRYLHTKFRFPDLPAMVIAYEVRNRTVTVKGAVPVSEGDDFPPSIP